MKSKYQVHEKGMISANQLLFLLVATIIATADIYLPSIAAQEAGKDAWLAVLVAMVMGFASTYIQVLLGKQYPEKTFIQYCTDILGTIPGKAVGAIYIGLFVIITWSTVAQFSEFFRTTTNPSVPFLVLHAVIVSIGAYAVNKELEVIARVTQILLPLAGAALLFIVVSNVPHMELDNFLPVLDDGFAPVLRGAFLMWGWFLESIILLQFFPFVSDKKHITSRCLSSVLIIAMGMMTGVLTMAIFGQLTEKLTFPAYNYVRFAAIGEYIQHLDVIFISVWILGIIIKIAIFFYAAVLGIGQLIDSPSYKSHIIPLGILVVVFASISVEGTVHTKYHLHYVFPIVACVLGFIVPLLLLLLCLIKKQLQKRKTNQ